MADEMSANTAKNANTDEPVRDVPYLYERRLKLCSCSQVELALLKGLQTGDSNCPGFVFLTIKKKRREEGHTGSSDRKRCKQTGSDCTGRWVWSAEPHVPIT